MRESNTESATRLVIACALATGDIFRVFPGERAALVESEDDLTDPDGVMRLESNRIDTDKFRGGGALFERVVYVPCEDCGGDGIEIGPAWIFDGEIECAEPSHHPARLPKWRSGAVYMEENSHPCCRCHGHGVVYEWTGIVVSRASLSEEAA